MRTLLYVLTALSFSTPISAFAASATAMSDTCYIWVAWGHPTVEDAKRSVLQSCGYNCHVMSTNPSNAAIAIASGALPPGTTNRFNCVIGLSRTSSTSASDAANDAINDCTRNGGQHCSAMWGPYHR